MYHSVTFGDKNTWDDWHLVSPTRPCFVPPEQKTTYLDIPGACGSMIMVHGLRSIPKFQTIFMAARCVVFWKTIKTGSMKDVSASKIGN